MSNGRHPMKSTSATVLNILPVEWIRAEQYCNVTGETMHTVQSRIRDGIWAAGKHYKRTGPRTLWINLPSVNEWVKNQPHVEAAAFPKASKSEKESADRVCA